MIFPEPRRLNISEEHEQRIRICPECGDLIGGPMHASGGRLPPLTSIPDNGDMGMCVCCGALLAWNGDQITGRWRVLTGEERATIIANHEPVANAIMVQREYREWHAADLARATTFISHALTAILNDPTPKQVPVIAAHYGAAMIDAGFHTHLLAT